MIAYLWDNDTHRPRIDPLLVGDSQRWKESSRGGSLEVISSGCRSYLDLRFALSCWSADATFGLH